jgi:signal transduction histidine kinase
MEEFTADASPLLARYLDGTQSICLLVADLNGVILQCNPQMADLLVTPREELIGQTLWGYLPDREAAGLRERVAGGVRGSREKFYLNLVDRHQVPHTLECLFDVHPDAFTLLGEAPRKADEALQEEMVRINNELALQSRENARKSRALEKALADLKEAQAKLVHQEKMASLGLMTAGVAHEINNPVAFVLNNQTTLRRDFDDLFSLVNLVGDSLEELRRACPAVAARIVAKATEVDLTYLADAVPRKITDNIDGLDRVREIVLDLRNFSRLDECEVKPCDVAEGIRGALRFLTPVLEHQQVRVVTNLTPLPPLVCSPGHLNQAVSNVVMNAAQASQPGQAVKVSTAHEDGYYVITVEDQGQGIAPEHLTKVFDPFFTTKPVGEGTGLGLSITHQIIQAHHGDIQINSTPGKGTSIRLRIPLSPVGTRSFGIDAERERS